MKWERKEINKIFFFLLISKVGLELFIYFPCSHVDVKKKLPNYQKKQQKHIDSFSH